MSVDVPENTPPRSELVNVVAWVQIIGSGFWGLVSLMLMGIAVALAWASRMTVQPGHVPYNPWPLFGVACVFLGAALLLLGAGTGLRLRHDWARRLTAALCYVGVVLILALFCLSYAGLNAMLARLAAVAQSSGTGSGAVDMVGLVIKAFLSSLTVATVALQMWVAHRLRGMAIIREFQPLPEPQDETGRS